MQQRTTDHLITVALYAVVTVVFFMRSDPATAETIRVATFNINYANNDLDQVIRTLQQSRADIFLIQETTAESEQRLRNEFRVSHPHKVFLGDGGEYLAERFGVISRWPLRNLKFLPPVNGGLFGSLLIETTVAGQSIQLANVHLSPFQVRRRTTIPLVLKAMSATESVHRREIDRIRTNIDPRRPTLVCGDFNSLSAFTAPLTLKTAGLVDSFAVVNPDAETQPTWNWPVGEIKIRFRIDYIFHSKHFVTQKSRIIETTASDHFLVVSELALTNPPD